MLWTIVFACLFLPFTIAFFIAFNQNNSKNRQTPNAKKLTKAKDRNPPITAHTLTSVRPSCFLRGQVCCIDYWQQNGNSLFGLNFRTCPHSTLRKKRRKNKTLRSTCEKCSFSKSSNQINIRLLNQGWIWILDCSFYEWIHWINKRNHVSINELISSLAAGTLDLLWL